MQYVFTLGARLHIISSIIHFFAKFLTPLLTIVNWLEKLVDFSCAASMTAFYRSSCQTKTNPTWLQCKVTAAKNHKCDIAVGQLIKIDDLNRRWLVSSAVIFHKTNFKQVEYLSGMLRIWSGIRGSHPPENGWYVFNSKLGTLQRCFKHCCHSKAQ